MIPYNNPLRSWPKHGYPCIVPPDLEKVAIWHITQNNAKICIWLTPTFRTETASSGELKNWVLVLFWGRTSPARIKDRKSPNLGVPKIQSLSLYRCSFRTFPKPIHEQANVYAEILNIQKESQTCRLHSICVYALCTPTHKHTHIHCAQLLGEYFDHIILSLHIFHLQAV